MSKRKELYDYMTSIKIAHDHMGVALFIRLKEAKDKTKMNQLIDESIPDDLLEDFKSIVERIKTWEKEKLDNLPFE